METCHFKDFWVSRKVLQKIGGLTIHKGQMDDSSYLQGNIFRILQHFATKLCNFSNFKMLFLAVVMDFVLLARIKISSIAGIVHYVRSYPERKYPGSQHVIPGPQAL